MHEVEKWDEAYLRSFVAANAEGQDLDYKLFSNHPKSDSTHHIAKAVSAFANATGGLLIVGVRDLKTKPPTYELEGIEPSVLSAEQLQQIISGNVSPKTTTSIRQVVLAGDSPKSVYIVSIPEGDAGKVYQSLPDKKFYRRYNDECLPMLEYEIRERYQRATGPLLSVDLSFPSLTEPQLLLPWGANQSLSVPITLIATVTNASQQPSEHAVFCVSLDDDIHGPDFASFGESALANVTSIRPERLKYGSSSYRLKKYEIQWSTAKRLTPIFYGVTQPLFARPSVGLCLPLKPSDHDYLIYWTAQAPHMRPTSGAVTLRARYGMVELIKMPDFKIDFPA